ncbi:MAG: bifunctional DNA-binding transcriptional regulator/O6-methylguanine-DNA methyltransferase Ada [Hyphomicrobium sp.]
MTQDQSGYAMTTAPTRTPKRRPPALDDVRMWQAIVARDPSFDGRFYFSVATTGVFCRPSCAARRAKRQNVAFHATADAAKAAGFRPCKRCRPDQQSNAAREAATIAAACRAIETAEAAPSLAELAGAAGLSPFHFQRRFKAIVGVTPKAYAVAGRRERLRGALQTSSTVTDAIYDSGFNSSGRFYDQSGEFLGMTPTAYRARGAGEEIRFAVSRCSLGKVLVAATERGVCAVLLGVDANELERDLSRRFAKARIVDGKGDIASLVARVVAFIERPTRRCDLPLDIRGTAFQHQVWTALQDIRPGATASYAEIAARIGKPTAVRAVAQACAANALAVVVPCHRVLRRNGDVSGYRWGVARKRALLKRERKDGG